MNLLGFIDGLIIAIFSGLSGAAIALNYTKSKLRSKSKTDDALANGNFTNTLHPLVKEIYELFVDNKTVGNFKQGYCEILVNEIKW